MKSTDALLHAEEVMRYFLKSAADIIDREFGELYAIKNPHLVAKLAEIGAKYYFEILSSQP